MNGYLQRLVKTATNPAESVHPMAGSIFAAVDRGDFNVVETEKLTSAVQNEGAAAAAAEISEAMPPALPRFKPLIPAQALPPAAGLSQTPELGASQNAAGLTQDEQKADHEPSVNDRTVFKPLIKYIERSSPDSMDATELKMTPGRMEANLKTRNVRRLAVASSSVPPAKNGTRTVGSHVAGDQQTDDIQIHIGRIEVTAVHPPAPTVAKPRHKEISLDAYLQRRDGRAR